MSPIDSIIEAAWLTVNWLSVAFLGGFIIIKFSNLVDKLLKDFVEEN